MATLPQAFYCLWQNEAVRERLFELLSKEDICSIRIANSACCNLVTKRLFLRTNLTFTANTFTKPSRIQALSRIGHHIEHLTFQFAHSDATFLPPLIHPLTGKEISYLYTPHTSMASVLARPKYGNSELGDILTQQYPPLFHSATNVPSFIYAMKHVPNMRHLSIKTPGQDPKERYRRDIVDYALISLRITLERTDFPKLTKLSLSGVHPSAFNYLRPAPGFGSSPAGTRRWRQIRKLYISVDSWDFYGTSPGLDNLKIIDDYIRFFAETVEKFHFTWLGRRGPCPLALSADPLFAPPRGSKKLFAEVTSPMSPLPPRPSRRPLVMPRLRYMQVRNATMNAPQLRDLVAAHKQSVREFDFENVVLINNGSWAEALAPLEDSGSESWSRYSIGGSVTSDKPGLVRSASGTSGAVVAASLDDEQLPSPSAAAAAASKELLDVDLEGMMLGGPNDVDVLEAGVEEWARGVTAAAQDGSMVDPMPLVPEGDEQAEDGQRPGPDDGGLASDIEAAKEASLAFSTKLKKRRIRKKSHRYHPKDGSVSEAEETADDTAAARSEAGSRSSKRRHTKSHKQSRSDETHDRSHSRSRHRSHSRHRGEHQHRHHHRRRHSDEAPEVPTMPQFIAEVLASDDEAAIALSSSRNNRPRTTQDPVPDANISAPILNPDPLPVLLQPTVYDPSSKTNALLNTTVTQSPSKPSLTRTPSNQSANSFKSTKSTTSNTNLTSTTPAGPESGLSPIQLHIEAELLHAAEQEAAEAATRNSALKRAREAVLAKLSREFVRRKASQARDKDSAAVLGLAGLSALSLGTVMGAPAVGMGGGGGGLSRFREGLFGRSIGIATGSAVNVGHAGGGGYGSYGFSQGNGSCMVLGGVRADHRTTVESASSAFVPLMFSRS
ncbi:splicing factor U2af large subunit A protein [Coniochaeta hoffmannii]|uniref:Splicing factor U2af large subunit A protein n=1 Tax=Coniochaeta hoffmannii TaxID=91930 RepID=A0AA38S0D1_9PEZI|nr:splicing factor U2af large subunit A protein [Coniochaeta hoffmannii]